MNTLLKISEAASIALHAMALLAENTSGKLLSNREISQKLRVSDAHLSKVLQRLEKAGLVHSLRGPKGGFKLAHAPKSISLLDVYEVIEGTIKDHECLLPQPICKNQKCIFGNLLRQINSEVKDYLKKTTLGNLDGFPPMRKKS
jgi:Rrf2 family protein